MFDQVLARVDGDAPDRWERVASLLPGKTVADVTRQYDDLENDVCFIKVGLVPFPQYNFGGGCPEQEHKKGVPWTEQEHK